MLADPLNVIFYDRHEFGEERWHCFSVIANCLLVAVISYPDSVDTEWVRVIGLRVATKHERRRYEDCVCD